MSAARFNIALFGSRRHRSILFAAHIVLLFALAFLSISPWIKIGLFLALLANGYHTYRALREQGEITRLTLEHEQLSAVHRGQWCEVQTFSPIFVTSWVIIFKLKVDDRTYRLALWQDSADVEQLRQLRVWLLCGRWRGMVGGGRM